AVHRHAGPVRQARGHDPRLPRDPRRPARRPAGAGVLHGRPDRGRDRACEADGRFRLVAVADRRKFSVSLVTPDGPAFEGEAEMIIVPGQAGEIGVLARHAPLIATLKAGSTRVYVDWDADDVKEFATGPGFFQVIEDRAIAL